MGKLKYCGYWTNDAAGQHEEKVFEADTKEAAEKLAGHYRTGLVVRKEKQKAK